MKEYKHKISLLAPARDLEVGKAAIQAGADAVTLQPDLLREMICVNPTNYIENAVTTFASDWESSQGTKSILDCE